MADAPKRLTFWGERVEPVPIGTGEAAKREADELAKREAERQAAQHPSPPAKSK